MSEPASVSAADLQRVAELANLELTADEETYLLRDLNAILGHVAQMNELDTENVTPMAQVSEVLGNGGVSVPRLREDIVADSLNRDRVMASAPDSDGVFFRVPKVIER